MQEYKSTVSSASSAVFESTETLLYYIGGTKKDISAIWAFIPGTCLLQRGDQKRRIYGIWG